MSQGKPTPDQEREVRTSLPELGGTDAADFARSLVRSALLFFDLHGIPIGGVASELFGLACKSTLERKLPEVLKSFAAELERRGADVDALKRRFANSEPHQRFFAEIASNAWRTTTADERTRVGVVLARGLQADERSLADLGFMLRRWWEMDRIEQLLLLHYGRAQANRKRVELDKDVFGADYYSSPEYGELMFRDQIHRKRMDELMSMGLLRPTDWDRWNEKKHGYQLEHFRLTNLGTELYDILTSTD
jgi:hypothetical protein